MGCKRNANFINCEAANEFHVLKNLIFFYSQTLAFHNAFSEGTIAPFFLCASSTVFLKSNNIDIYRVSLLGTNVPVHAFNVLC